MPYGLLFVVYQRPERDACNMNPSDIREALLARHAQHVVPVHFLIALFTAGVLSSFSHSDGLGSTLLRAHPPVPRAEQQTTFVPGSRPCLVRSPP